MCSECSPIIEKHSSSPYTYNRPLLTVKAHLHYIRNLGPNIRVRARTQLKQVNWCFLFTLIRVRVRDFCLERLCPSSSLHVAISSDADVRGFCTSIHWGWVTHMCMAIWDTIGLDNGLPPVPRQAIIWISVGILSMTPLGTNFCEILIEI